MTPYTIYHIQRQHGFSRQSELTQADYDAHERGEVELVMLEVDDNGAMSGFIYDNGEWVNKDD